SVDHKRARGESFVADACENFLRGAEFHTLLIEIKTLLIVRFEPYLNPPATASGKSLDYLDVCKTVQPCLAVIVNAAFLFERCTKLNGMGGMKCERLVAKI